MSDQSDRSGREDAEFVALVREVVLLLSETEREAIMRYYRDLQPAETIEKDLQFSPGEFDKLRRRVRRLFLDQVRRRRQEKSRLASGSPE